MDEDTEVEMINQDDRDRRLALAEEKVKELEQDIFTMVEKLSEITQISTNLSRSLEAERDENRSLAAHIEDLEEYWGFQKQTVVLWNGIEFEKTTNMRRWNPDLPDDETPMEESEDNLDNSALAPLPTGNRNSLEVESRTLHWPPDSWQSW